MRSEGAGAGRIVLRLVICAVALSIVAGAATGQTPTWTEQKSRVDQKLREIHQLVPAWIQAGGDQRHVTTLGAEVDRHLKAGDLARAEEKADLLLGILKSRDATRAKTLRDLQGRIDDWMAAGGDPSLVLPLGQKLGELLQAGTPEQVDAQIQRILALVSQPLPRGAVRSVAAPGPVPVTVRSIPADAEIVFYALTATGFEIFTMKADGGSVTQITFSSAQQREQTYEHVAVSFDRKMIAANRYLKGGTGPTGVWVIDLERKVETRLLHAFFTAGNGGVAWSPDGFLYFAGRRNPREKESIFRVSPDGSGLKSIVTLEPSADGFLGDVSVSEDGSMLAYIRAVGLPAKGGTVLKTQVWVARIDGSGQRMVDDGGPALGNRGGFPIGDFDPEISPDNTRVVFSRTNIEHVNFKESFNTAHDLWVATLDGSAPARRVTRPGPISIIPDWRGSKILFTEYSEAGRYTGLALISPDGTGYRRLEPGRTKMWEGGRHGKWIPTNSVAALPSR